MIFNFDITIKEGEIWQAIEEINYNKYKCHECGYLIENPDDLDLADEEGY